MWVCLRVGVSKVWFRGEVAYQEIDDIEEV